MKNINDTYSTASLSTQDSESIFYPTFDPKMTNRFICYIKDKDKHTLIPTFILTSVTRPIVTRIVDQHTKQITWKWHPIEIEAYDPISPSATEIFMEYIKNPKPFDICIKILGPVGDTVVEEWELSDAEIIEIDFGTLDWRSYSEDKKPTISSLSCDLHYKGGEPATVKAKISYEYATLKL